MPGELVVDKPDEQSAQEETNQEKAAEGSEDSKETKEESSASTDAPASRAVVGIIYPPPEVRSIQLIVGC